MLPRARRRGRAGLRPVEHAAPDGDPGDRRPGAGRAETRGDRAVPADGWWLRRQGDAAPRVCRGGRSRRHTHRSAGPRTPDPRPGHDDDGQAAWLPRAVAGGGWGGGGAPGPPRPPNLPRRVGGPPLRARAWAPP